MMHCPCHHRQPLMSPLSLTNCANMLKLQICLLHLFFFSLLPLCPLFYVLAFVSFSVAPSPLNKPKSKFLKENILFWMSEAPAKKIFLATGWLKVKAFTLREALWPCDKVEISRTAACYQRCRKCFSYSLEPCRMSVQWFSF